MILILLEIATLALIIIKLVNHDMLNWPIVFIPMFIYIIIVFRAVQKGITHKNRED